MGKHPTMQTNNAMKKTNYADNKQKAKKSCFTEQIDKSSHTIVVDGGIGGMIPSTIVDCTTDKYEVIREGAGEFLVE